MPVIPVSYYTDPGCPWSWAAEPALRKLLHEFGEGVSVEYLMCGMAREFEDPIKLVGEALEAADASGMPVDARLWLGHPPASSHPACIAVKAAAEQGDPGAYLRRLREGYMCRRRKLDVADALIDEARLTPGIDIERFSIDLRSHAVLEAFAADVGRRGERPLPSFEFRGEDGSVHGVYGFEPYEELRQAAIHAGATPRSAGPSSVEQALQRYNTLATIEVATLCDLPGPRAPAELWRLAAEWRVRPERVGSGELWSRA